MQKKDSFDDIIPELEEFFLIESFGEWILKKDIKTIQICCLAKNIIEKYKEVKGKDGKNK